MTELLIFAGLVIGVMLLCTGAYLEHHEQEEGE